MPVVAHFLVFDAAPQLIERGNAPHFRFRHIGSKVRHVHGERLGCGHVIFRHSAVLWHRQFLNIEDRLTGDAIQYEYFGTFGWYQYCRYFLTVSARQIDQHRLRGYIPIPQVMMHGLK